MTLTAEQYCLKVTDGTHDTPKTQKVGYPLITSKNILNGRLDMSDVKLISEEDYINVNKRSNVEQWDILFSMIGTVGEVYLHREEEADFAIKNIGLFKMGGDKAKALKLYYFLKSDYFQNMINVRLSGSIQSFLPLTFLRKIQLPDLYSISSDNINDVEKVQEKININNNLINHLDEYTQLLFHKWFVDFNFLDENGKPYKDTGGEMIEVDGKRIPKGWSWSDISQVAKIVDCLHSKKPVNNGDNPNNCLLQLENITMNGLLDLRSLYLVSDEAYKKWTSRIEVKEGDLIITNAGRVGAIAQIPEGYKFGIGRNITAIRPNAVPPAWFYLFFNSTTAQLQIKRNTDKGAFFGSLNVRGIKELRIIIPTDDLLVQFESKARPLRRKMELLNNERQLLEETRDLLIKKLINN